MQGGKTNFRHRPIMRHRWGLAHVPGIAVLHVINIAPEQWRDPKPQNSAGSQVAPQERLWHGWAGTRQISPESTWQRTPRWAFGGI